MSESPKQTEKEYIYEIFDKYVSVYNMLPSDDGQMNIVRPPSAHSINEIDQHIIRHEVIKIPPAITISEEKYNDSNDEIIIEQNNDVIDNENSQKIQSIDKENDNHQTEIESDNKIKKKKGIIGVFKNFFSKNKSKNNIRTETNMSKTTNINNNNNIDAENDIVMFDNSNFKKIKESPTLNVVRKKFHDELERPTRSRSLDSYHSSSSNSPHLNKLDLVESINNDLSSNKTNDIDSNNHNDNCTTSGQLHESETIKKSSKKTSSTQNDQFLDPHSSKKLNKNNNIEPDDNISNNSNKSKSNISAKTTDSNISNISNRSNVSSDSNRSNKSNISNRSNRSNNGDDNIRESRSFIKMIKSSSLRSRSADSLRTKSRIFKNNDVKKITLNDVLLDSDLLIVFLVFCIKEVCHENICFLLEILIFEKMIYPKVVLITEIKRIRERYLDTDSIMRINISANNNFNFIEKLSSKNCEKCDNKIFDDMKTEINCILMNDVFVRFINKYAE